MTGLPIGWAQQKLGTFFARTASVDPSKSPQETFQLFSVPSFSQGIPEVLPANEIRSSKQAVAPDDVLLCRIVPHINRVWVVSKKQQHRQIASGEWIVLRDHQCDPNYLRYLLSEGSFRDEFLKTVAGVGGSLMRARSSEVSEIEVPIAPRAEQRRIVAKLDSLSARTTRARTELERVPKLIAKYKQAILEQAFAGELTRKWRDRHPALVPVDVRLSKLRAARRSDRKLARRVPVEEAPVAPLPATWAWVSPDEVANDEDYSIAIGPFGSNLVRSDYTESGVRLVFVRDIRRERFDTDGARYVSPEKAQELRQHIVRAGDVLITKMGDPPGDTALYPPDAASAVITADCIKLSPNPKLALSQFLVYGIRADCVQAQLKEITAGVAQQKVSLERFRKIALPIPPLQEQREIVRQIATAFAWLDKVAAEHTRASHLLPKLDQAILAKAFRGELVPQDPRDEPASVLLERIKAERSERDGRKAAQG